MLWKFKRRWHLVLEGTDRKMWIWEDRISIDKNGERGHISLLLQNNEKASTRGKYMQRDNTLWLQAIVERTLTGLHCPARDKLYYSGQESPSLIHKYISTIGIIIILLFTSVFIWKTGQRGKGPNIKNIGHMQNSIIILYQVNKNYVILKKISIQNVSISKIS